jgi:GT2 family glycosyltransferase
VSVVVPTRARTHLLDRCLQALAEQSLAPDQYEIIVADDGPDPNTLNLVAGWRACALRRGGPRIRYVANHGPHGPAAARNRGWRIARAPVIAFTDDDTVPSRGWLAHAMAAFGDAVDALSGRLLMPVPDLPTDYERDAKRLETSEFITANCFCRKSMLETLGGFDERFRFAWREDSDLHFRLLERQARIAHAPDALVIHPVRPSPWGVSLLQLRKMSFDALLYKKHPRLYRQKIRATPRWDYYAIVAALLLALAALAAGKLALALGAGLAWAAMSAALCLKRLRGNAKTPSHIAEMALTSALIPPLAVFWRIVGAVRFRTVLA